MARMNVPQAETPIKKEYGNFRGIDLASPPSMVNPSRSPDCLNVYKDYTSTTGQAIETRLGFKKIGTTDNKIYGIHAFNDKDVLIHEGNTIWRFNDFDTVADFPTEKIDLSNGLMNEATSTSFLFSVDDDKKLYILDGNKYWVYDGNSLSEVEGYVPTTRINADPSGANGTDYQGVNFISDYRINTFVGDGASTLFYLDGYPEELPIVKVNGINVSVSSYSQSDGTVTLSSAPPEPLTAGEGNIEIKYKQTVIGNADKIRKCTIAKIFDNRVFFAGSPNEEGSLFHSELEDPTYFRDDSFYNDGGNGDKIVSLVLASNNIIVIKEDNGLVSPKVFYHSPSLDYDYGKVYPTSATDIFLGTNLKGINFNDTVCYTTSRGLDSIYLRMSKSTLYHKSSLVDRKLANSNLLDMIVWDNYLAILAAGGYLYLADSRQTHSEFGTYEYEWYIWDNLKISENDYAKALFTLNGKLFFITDNAICRFEGTNDDGNTIYSYWTTPEDVFGYPAYLKTVNKRGAYALVKQIPNSEIKIACNTDKERDALLYQASTSGFDFNNFNFSEFNFSVDINSSRFFKIKKKKIQYFSLKFYSDQLNKPLGVYKCVLEYVIKKYVRGI